MFMFQCLLQECVHGAALWALRVRSHVYTYGAVALRHVCELVLCLSLCLSMHVCTVCQRGPDSRSWTARVRSICCACWPGHSVLGSSPGRRGGSQKTPERHSGCRARGYLGKPLPRQQELLLYVPPSCPISSPVHGAGRGQE